MKRSSCAFVAACLTLAVGCGGGAPPPSARPSPRGTEGKIRDAMAGVHRSQDARARDRYRHPFETLTFFGLRDDMTVVELWSGTGWYTAILAPVLADRGKLISTRTDDLEVKKTERPSVYGKVELVDVAPREGKFTLGPDASADLVLTFRNVHNWIMGGYEKDVFAAAFRVLKRGAKLGVVEHRAKPGTDVETTKKTGYVTEVLVVELAEGAGFRLEEKSEVNANPKDTKDYPEGVWTLPPTLKLEDKDKDKYLAIGESDRMTMRFVKP